MYRSMFTLPTANPYQPCLNEIRLGGPGGLKVPPWAAPVFFVGGGSLLASGFVGNP